MLHHNLMKSMSSCLEVCVERVTLLSSMQCWVDAWSLVQQKWLMAWWPLSSSVAHLVPWLPLQSQRFDMWYSLGLHYWILSLIDDTKKFFALSKYKYIIQDFDLENNVTHWGSLLLYIKQISYCVLHLMTWIRHGQWSSLWKGNWKVPKEEWKGWWWESL